MSVGMCSPALIIFSDWPVANFLSHEFMMSSEENFILKKYCSIFLFGSIRVGQS